MKKKIAIFLWVLTVCLLSTVLLPALASADYLPTMPPATGVFGTAISASSSFDDGYHWDDTATPTIDERDIPEHYTYPSPMPGYSAGDQLDYHWVWVHGFGEYVIWEFTEPVDGVRIYPCQDNGPYLGGEFDEFDVWGSNDLVTWVQATEVALYYDDINNIRTHDGVKDYRFNGEYQYIKVRAIYAPEYDFEIDAVEALPPSSPPETETVEIDIKPGSFPNSINLKSKGNVPVAIFSGPTFDATTVDRSTVTFAGASPLLIGESPEDINGDGLLDIVLHFNIQDLNLQPGDTEASLTGRTFDGQEFEAWDSVRIIGSKTTPKNKHRGVSNTEISNTENTTVSNDSANALKDTSWATAYIESLAAEHILSGYTDGTFRSSNTVTRAEFVKMLILALREAPLSTPNNSFSDTSDHWAKGYIEKAKVLGIITGYPDGTFKPDKPVSRAEIAKMIYIALNIRSNTTATSFTDVPTSHWAYKYIMGLKNQGIVTGYPDGTFRPSNQTTRAEAAKIIFGILR
jgi:hypothetical protein